MEYISSFGDEIKFDENGDPAAMYDLVNWQMGQDGGIEFVTIGKFDETTTVGKQKLQIEEPIIVWNGNETNVRESIEYNYILYIAFFAIIYVYCDWVVKYPFSHLLRFPCRYAAAFVPQEPGSLSDLTSLCAAMIVWFAQLGR